MRIAVLYTGGTIGCVGDPLEPLEVGRFREAFEANLMPVLRREHPDLSVGYLSFGAAHDSTNLQPRDWCKMASEVLAAYELWDAFLILHGTDTLAYSASALSFLLTGLDRSGFPDAVLSKPVVVTGSQRPLFRIGGQGRLGLEFNTDAFQNVCGAVAAAHTGLPEVCLYFHGRLLRGNRTAKTNASRFDAFSSPNYPALGQAGVDLRLDNEAILALPPTPEVSLDAPAARARLRSQLDHLTRHVDATRVMPFLAFPAPYDDRSEPNTSVLADLLDACLARGVHGLVLAAYGEGNFPSGNPRQPSRGAVYRALEAASRSGVILLDCSQVLAGVVDAGAYASGSWLREVGAVGGYDMTGEAALAKLVYLHALRDHDGRGWDRATIERLMRTNLAGEIMDIDRLDSRGRALLSADESICALDGTARLRNEPERGPVLRDAAGRVLWAALAQPGQADLPGRLALRGDGNLVFYDASNTVRWSSDTATEARPASMLILSGASDPGGISLGIYDYARGRVLRTLFGAG